MPLRDLSDKLFLCISGELDSDAVINAFARSTWRLYRNLNTYLYRHNVQQLGSSGLLWAAEHGLTVVVQRFLDEGANVEAKDARHRTPLCLAAVVKLLLAQDGANPDSRDENDRRPLSWAADNGHETVAAENGRKVVVELLLDQFGIDPDSRNKYGQTPLLLAAWNGHRAVVKLLVTQDSIDPDSQDLEGATPTSRAIEYGHEAVVVMLLDILRKGPSSVYERYLTASRHVF
ncbi:hypothetical protein V500_06070 [Pseudogymnoascus sp. VKM F-4518 (FW-2643)]|nr:hypothetical protein V500_06070 [Pseudogymnoascus sp. VKM F-4518 (FW-2643)]